MPAKFPELFIDGITLKRETVTKFLGLFIDENVTWKPHINIIYIKISKSIGPDSRPLFKEIGALNIYQINIFNILRLMFKSKTKLVQSFRKFIYLKTKK